MKSKDIEALILRSLFLLFNEFLLKEFSEEDELLDSEAEQLMNFLGKSFLDRLIKPNKTGRRSKRELELRRNALVINESGHGFGAKYQWNPHILFSKVFQINPELKPDQLITASNSPVNAAYSSLRKASARAEKRQEKKAEQMLRFMETLDANTIEQLASLAEVWQKLRTQISPEKRWRAFVRLLLVTRSLMPSDKAFEEHTYLATLEKIVEVVAGLFLEQQKRKPFTAGK